MGTATGGSKLVQDLRCCVLEPMGNDEMHPSFGSIIDGGTDTEGVFHQGVVGERNDDQAALTVSMELQRIIKAYQRQQLARYQNDLVLYGSSTLTADEALLALSNLDIQQVMDQMLVNATLQTGMGSLPLTQTLSVT